MSQGIANFVSNQNPNIRPFLTQNGISLNSNPQNSNLNDNQNNSQDDLGKNNKILSSFLSSFINQDFFTKIINVVLYQSDFTSANVSLKTSEVTKFINTFLNEVNKQIKKAPMNFFNDVPKPTLLATTALTREMVNLREDITGRFVSYDNVMQHFPKQDLITSKILSTVSNNRIKTQDEFKLELDNVLQVIQSYNEVTEIGNTLKHWDSFIMDANKDDTSVINLIRMYRNLIAKSYNELAELTTIHKQDELDDFIVLHDKISTKKVVDNLMSFLSEGYNFFKTGYKLLDTNIGGLESSTFHLITGPSNHAKSIYMINLCKSILLNNQSEFVKDDVFVYITLEDDLNKVLRRFISIFGNVDSELTKQLFIVASSMFKQIQESYDKSTVSNLISGLLTEVVNEAIIKQICNANCKIIIKHCAENSFSAADATKFIDSLKLQGYNTKALFVDYVDVMKPSSTRYSNYNDYDAQGLIIHELRKISQNYKLPVMSITQNTRESENVSQSMGNNLIGDSYKKVRFSDYIYMIRLRSDLDLLAPSVKFDITNADDDDTAQLNMTDMSGQYIQQLIPFEVQITKAKEGKKNVQKFHIFSGLNLRIYDNLAEFYSDLPIIIRNNKWLRDQIQILQMENRQHLSIGSDTTTPINLI